MEKALVLIFFAAVRIGAWCYCSQPAHACSTQTQISCAAMSCCSHHQTLANCCAKEMPPAQAPAASFKLSPEIVYAPDFFSHKTVVSPSRRHCVIQNESPPSKLCALTQSKAFRAPPL